MAPSELEVVREMARCLRLIRAGRVLSKRTLPVWLGYDPPHDHESP